MDREQKADKSRGPVSWVVQYIKTVKTIGDSVDDSLSEYFESDSCPGSSGLQVGVRSARLKLARFVHEKTGLADD